MQGAEAIARDNNYHLVDRLSWFLKGPLDAFDLVQDLASLSSIAAVVISNWS